MFNLKSLVVLLVIGSALALKKDADCDLRATARKCIKSGFLLESLDKKTKQLPRTMNDMNELCTNSRAGEECVRNFINKCSESDKEKKALTHSLEGMVRLLKRVCKTDAKKTEFISNVGVCGNNILNDGTKCLTDYKKYLFAAEKENDKDKILKVLCCKVHDIGPCIEERMRAKGSAICSDKNIEYMRNIEKAFKEELLSVICADYEQTSNKCKGFEAVKSSDDVTDKSLVVVLKSLIDKAL